MAKHSQRRSSKNRLSLERSKSGNTWVFSHPQQLREVTEDLDEVREIVAAGETDIAIDELHWLLEICSEMLPAHFLLGKLAVEANNDVPLGRGHFGAGYQLGLLAWRRAGKPVPVAALHPANRVFYDCGRGLAWCLDQLEKTPMAIEVVENMIEMDPGDPLELAGWIDEMRTGGNPMVDLSGL